MSEIQGYILRRKDNRNVAGWSYAEMEPDPDGGWYSSADVDPSIAELEAENRDGRQAFSDLMNTTDIIRAELEAENHEQMLERHAAVAKMAEKVVELEADKQRLRDALASVHPMNPSEPCAIYRVWADTAQEDTHE